MKAKKAGFAPVAAPAAAARKKHTKHVPNKKNKKTIGKATRPMRPKKQAVTIVVAAPPTPAAAAPRTTLPVEVVVAAPAAAARKKHTKHVPNKKNKKTIGKATRPMKSKIVKVVVAAAPAPRRNRHGQPAPAVPPRDARYEVAVRVPPPLPVRRARTTLPVEVVEAITEEVADGALAALEAQRAAIANGTADDFSASEPPTPPTMGGGPDYSNIAYALNDADDSGPLVMPDATEIGGSHGTEVMAGDDDGEAMEGTGMVAALGMENE